MRPVFGVLLALVGPIAMGWLLVSAVWPKSPIALRAGLGASLGTGLTGAAYYLALLLTNSSHLSFIISEIVLTAGIAVLIGTRRWVRPADSTLPVLRSDESVGRIVQCITAGALLCAIAALIFFLMGMPEGQWDAVAIWNVKARFIFLSPLNSLQHVLDGASGTIQGDYPLLLPVLVARGWQYAGETPLVPISLAVLFGVATLLITTGTLRILTSRNQEWLAASLLVGTPFFTEHTASLYADIVLCCFITTAVGLLCIHEYFETRGTGLLALAGIAVGLAACTKDEGILFAGAAGLLLLWTVFKRGEGPKAFAVFAAGAMAGLTPLLFFKTMYSPTSPITAKMAISNLFESMFAVTSHATILRSFQEKIPTFGEWRINPLPLMLFHTALSWKRISSVNAKRARFVTGMTLVLMMGGYYIVYLISPYPLQWHLDSSINRLIFQLWPTALVFYSLLVAPRQPEDTSLVSGRTRTAIAAAVLVMFAIPIPNGNRPAKFPAARIEVDRTDVAVGDSYVLRIPDLPDSDVLIKYSLNDSPAQTMPVRLDGKARITLNISQLTPKGVYRFLAFESPGSDWINVHDDVRIHVR